MKKKYTVSSKEKKDWIDFTKQIGNIYPKDADFLQKNAAISKVRKLDLHGYSISESNKIVKKFIVESFDYGYKKLLIVTGKGFLNTKNFYFHFFKNMELIHPMNHGLIKNGKISLIVD